MGDVKVIALCALGVFCVGLVGSYAFGFARSVDQRRLRGTHWSLFNVIQQFSYRQKLVGFVIAVAIACLRFGVTTGVLMGGIVGIGVWQCKKRQQKQRRDRDIRALIAYFDDVASLLSTGKSLANALTAVTPKTPHLRRSIEQLRQDLGHGVTLDAALARIVNEMPTEYVRGAIASLRLAHRLGSPAASVCKRISAQLREQCGIADELGALTAQVRASTGLLLALPIVFGAFTTTMSDASRQFLLHSSGGAVLLVVAIGLETLGITSMRYIMGLGLR